MTLEKSLYLGLVIFALSLFTCQEYIEFEEPETFKESIYIEGKLTKGSPSTVVVKIGQVFDFVTSPSLYLAEYVQLIDESENVLELKTRAQGIFKLEIPEDHPYFKVDYGSAYKIKFKLRTGETYESSYDTLYQVPTPTDLTLDKISKNVSFLDGTFETQEIVTFNISTPLVSENGNKPNLMWELQSVYKQTDYPTGGGLRRCPVTGPPKVCYLTIDPVENYKVLNATSLASSQVTDFNILEADNSNTFVFSEGHYLTAFQQSISNAAYEYWSRVNEVVYRDGTIFETPAGKVRSNIKNIDSQSQEEVYGYFFVTESKLIRAYVSADYAGNPRPQCPAAGDMHSVFCDNCLCEINSTTEKPDYWVE